MDHPAIFVVATPIGNLDDISARAIATLKQVDIIAAEDTRNTRKLLSHFGVSGKELVSYNDHQEQLKSEWLVDRLLSENKTMALVSDAGTPCIADPGYRLVRLAKAKNLKVYTVPGPSSLTSLLSVSGLPSDRVLFVGFLPTKDSALRAEVLSWGATRASVVYFEPTRRLSVSLKIIAEIYPFAEVSVGRELTKLYEEVYTAPVLDVIEWVVSHAILKGEAVVMVSPYADKDPKNLEQTNETIESLEKMARDGFLAGKSLKDLLKTMQNEAMSRSELYQLLLDVKSRL